MKSALFCAALAVSVVAIPTATQVVYAPYDDAKPILQAMAEIIPAELRGAPPDERVQIWDGWVKKRDTEIRGRLAQGDADSVVNFLLFGTSFTKAPRFTAEQLHLLSTEKGVNGQEQTAVAWRVPLETRVRDLVHGMAVPGSNERLQFARKTLERAGIDFSAVADEKKVNSYLYENLQRVVREQADFQQALQTARSLNDPTEEFAERSKLYAERGLSLDTSLPPDYALEVALGEMKRRGLLSAASVKRVGIIGPGLDFTDKQEGFDFYPTQTVQPFAVMDSLLRLRLAQRGAVEIDTLDLSPRVLQNVAQARQRAEKGRGYTIQLPRDPARGWNAELATYWRRFGDQIGSPAEPATLPAALKGVALRAIRVRPEFVSPMRVFDVDIVLQRAILAEDAKFDLLIATNILVYYGTFEQSLAMTNIAAMLKPGGYLLTNNALLELPSSEMHSVGYQTVLYSDRPDDGDHIVWYQKKVDAAGPNTTQ